MADDGWITVGKKKNPSTAAKPKTPVGMSPIPKKTTSTSTTSTTKSFGPSQSFKAASSYGSTTKYGAGTNKKPTSGPSARKIEEEADFGEGSLARKTIDHTISENIQRARNAKGWTQKDLAREIHESPATVRDYENGKAVANGAVIVKMEKALGVSLK